MKKNYMKPSVKVAAIKVQHILAGSLTEFGGETSENLSKKSFDFIDEDSEEDCSAAW